MDQDTTSKVRDADQHTDQAHTGRDQDGTGRASGSLVSVYEAADVLGVTVDAIRKRIQRGTIPHERHEDGRVYVILDKARTLQDGSSAASGKVRDGGQDEGLVRYQTNELVESLQDQVGFLRRELERKDAILLRMAERIPELEAPRVDLGDVREDPPEPQGGPEEASPRSDRGTASEDAQEPAGRRSWWRRFFGFE